VLSTGEDADAPDCPVNLFRWDSLAFPCSSGAAPWILAATILGSSLAFIDGSVVNLALPALQANFNATVANIQWVVEAYSLFRAALMLTGGASYSSPLPPPGVVSRQTSVS